MLNIVWVSNGNSTFSMLQIVYVVCLIVNCCIAGSLFAMYSVHRITSECSALQCTLASLGRLGHVMSVYNW